MAKPRLSADFLPKLPAGSYWRLSYVGFGLYELFILRRRRWWLPRIEASAMCPLDCVFGGDAETAISQSADAALSKMKQNRESMTLLQQIALYEGSHRG